MDISVIIPHYNLQPALLTRAIESVAGQWAEEYNLWEVIVVDDGSDQPPVATVASLHRDNVRLFCRPHARQGAARNFGLTQAQGQYILFLDADDYILPGTLAPLLTLARSKGLDILRFHTVATSSPSKSRYHRVQAEDRRSTALPSCSTTISGEEYMLRHNLHDSPVSFLFRRDLAMSHDICFPENIYLEDSFFTALLHHHAATLCTADSKVYAYYQRSNSTVNNATAQHRAMLRTHHLTAIRQLGDFIKDEAGRSDTRGLQHKHTSLIVDYIRRICRDLTWTEIRDEQLPLMRRKGLLPLPLRRDYGIKYAVFAHMANMPAGLHMLTLLSHCGIV